MRTNIDTIKRKNMDITFEPCELVFDAGQNCNVKFTIRLSETLLPGDTIAFQFPNAWLLINGPSLTRELQSENPEAPHYVAIEADDVSFSMKIQPRNLFFPGGNCRHGRLVTATLKKSRIEAGNPILIRYANTFAPYLADRDNLWLKVKDEVCDFPLTLHTQSLDAIDMRILAPSVVRPGETFEILLITLDKFQNRSRTEMEDITLGLADGTVLQENITFTGGTRIPVTLSNEGIYRLRCAGTLSNAIRVDHTATLIRWGDMHVHSKLSHDAQGANVYDYARHVSDLDFAAITDHWEGLGPVGEDMILRWAKESTEPGCFIALLADERNPRTFTGHHNLYFRNVDSFQKWRDAKGNIPRVNHPPLDLAKAQREPPELMILPHHTGINWGGWRKGDDSWPAVKLDAAEDYGLRPVMEIYSHHGQSELYAPHHVLAYEWNRMRRPERRSNSCYPGPYYAQDYWMAGKHLGVIASSDDHAGQAGIRHGGIAAVYSDKLTTASLFDALFRRHCYATTGERILVDFSVDNEPMGTILKRDVGTKVNLKLRVWGTRNLLRVDILCYHFGRAGAFMPILTAPPRPEGLDAFYEIEEKIVEPCMYYARVIQEPLDWPDMAWTSPIWIEV